MISTIIFDLADVLLTGLLGVEKYIFEMYGLRVENSQWKIKELNEFFHGKISEEKYWEAVIRYHGWQLTVDGLKSAVRRNFREIKGTREIIKELKKNGYK